MNWDLYTKNGAAFYFEEEILRGTDRDTWSKFKYTLSHSDNPRQWAVAFCPEHSVNMLLQIPESEMLIAIRCHDSKHQHPKLGKCIFLIKLGMKEDFTV